MSAQAPILRRNLHDELAVQLKDMLTRGELKPGEKISEPTLCERFGVSRTPLREALKVMAAEGLIILSPHRGARVARISPEEVNEIFPIMGVLEAMAGEEACARATEVDVARLEKLHAEMVQYYQASDAPGYLRLNRQIHEALFDLAGNGALTQLYQTLMVRIHQVRFVAQKSPERWAEAVADHEAMMVALRARDKAKLGAILKEHLRHRAVSVNEAMASLD